MSLAGLFLMFFLLIHLSTNFLMLLGSRDAFDQAVAFLSANPLIKVMEYVLFAGFLIHIIIGALIQLHNYRSRPVKYHVKLKSETATFSRFMFHTGVIIFIFLVIHLINFYFIRLGLVDIPEHANDSHDFYNMAVVLFSNPWYCGIYLLAFVFLGFHLNHAFQSAFQTLGLNHSKYFPAIKVIGSLYALLISIGFALIPLYFLFIYQA